MSHTIILGTRRPERFAPPSHVPTSRSRSAQRRPLPRPTAPPTPADQIEQHIAANFYPTPPEATRALLSVETFDSDIWEPACGEGHIAKVLDDAGYHVVSTDLNAWGYGTPHVNFLDERHPRAKHIVTNPPYGAGLGDDFIDRALSLTRITGGKVAMLLNIASLAHERRTARWRTTPPARLYAVDGVVCWPDPHRSPPKHFLQHRYVWAVWEQGHHGPASFWWLSAREHHLA